MLEDMQAGFQVLGHPPVIGVQKGNILSFCLLHASVASRPRSGVWLLYESNSCIVIASNDPKSIIRRAVVNDNKLIITYGLSKYRVQSAPNKAFLIVKRNYNTDHCHRCKLNGGLPKGNMIFFILIKGSKVVALPNTEKALLAISEPTHS